MCTIKSKRGLPFHYVHCVEIAKVIWSSLCYPKTINTFQDCCMLCNLKRIVKVMLLLMCGMMHKYLSSCTDLPLTVSTSATVCQHKSQDHDVAVRINPMLNTNCNAPVYSPFSTTGMGGQHYFDKTLRY